MSPKEKLTNVPDMDVELSSQPQYLCTISEEVADKLEEEIKDSESKGDYEYSVKMIDKIGDENTNILFAINSCITSATFDETINKLNKKNKDLVNIIKANLAKAAYLTYELIKRQYKQNGKTIPIVDKKTYTDLMEQLSKMYIDSETGELNDRIKSKKFSKEFTERIDNENSIIPKMIYESTDDAILYEPVKKMIDDIIRIIYELLSRQAKLDKEKQN